MNAQELAGLGKIEKEVEAFQGLTVKFHSLTVKEEIALNAALSAAPQDLVSRSEVLQLETLINSIEKVGERVFSDPKELREYLIGLQRHVLAHLWDVWNSHFDQESAKKIEELKKN
jgi:hypothetical protein